MKKERFSFPSSVQGDLFKMLTPKQRIETANVLRHLKNCSQIELCFILMDYIEQGEVPSFEPDQFILALAFTALTFHNVENKAPWAIKPCSDRLILKIRNI